MYILSTDSYQQAVSGILHVNAKAEMNTSISCHLGGEIYGSKGAEKGRIQET